MRYLPLRRMLQLHEAVVAASGGSAGVRDLGALQSALAQPEMAFGGEELYPTLEEKAASLGFSLVCNHPFVDGNKRAGHAAMEAFLELNGHKIEGPVDEQEAVILRLASGEMRREEFTEWVRGRVVPAG